jgi:hypothetical protein
LDANCVEWTTTSPHKYCNDDRLDPPSLLPSRLQTSFQSIPWCKYPNRKINLLPSFCSLICVNIVGSMPGHHYAIALQNLGLQHPQLGAESHDTGTRNLGQPFVARIGNHFEQFIDTLASDRRDDPELGKMKRIALITAVCWRMKRWRVRCSIRVSTNRMLALVTASQMASASAASFFCRLT